MTMRLLRSGANGLRLLKRVCCMTLSLLIAGGVVGCTSFSPAPKRSKIYMDVFDTVTEIAAYGIDETTFEADVERLHDELVVYHRLYDIYNTYSDLSNLKTINDAAGGAPVKVDSRILDLLAYGLDAYEHTDGRVNILFGTVLSLWHDAREQSLADPTKAFLPNEESLAEAAKHVSPKALVIDREAGTVCLNDPKARIDVGAIAKGYAAERIAQFAQQQLGWTSALINVGGNVRAIGGKGGAHSDTPFTIGVQNPDTSSAQTYLTTVNIADLSVVTSGDYQRYYTVNEKRYAHIIDPETLYPATYVRAVTVVCEDSGLADVLSTALFCLPPDQGKALLEKTPNAYAVWVMPDGELQYSDGFDDLMEGVTK